MKCKIFITGSADGLGSLAAKALVKLGHEVVLHARNAERKKQALKEIPNASDVLTADLSSIEETKDLASKVNASGMFDAIIHNAGVYRVPKNGVTKDGLPLVFAVNTIAPYILTGLIQKPKRLIYLSSGMHSGGDPEIDDTKNINYSDTKLHNVMLAMIVARKFQGIFANAVDPGWVPTKMGGAGAPDSLEKGFETQVWLAVSNDPESKVSGCYFHHKRQTRFLPVAKDINAQQKFLDKCEQITGVAF